ncbi:MAG: Sec-independent protein translocase protein TatB [Novosphingobium sp.]|uniref:Sec-independent protein translocase protein TatB n=1 Tax=Novosphingobium sp. TaxID=1874826 RepID=UPI0032BD46F3
MFDIGWDEMLLTAIVAIVVIGPKDLPRALRVAGQWLGKVRRVSGHFRAGIESMIREAEIEEMETKWREQNEAIMREHPIASAELALDGAGAGAEPVAAEAQQPAKPKRKTASKPVSKKPASKPRKPKAPA